MNRRQALALLSAADPIKGGSRSSQREDDVDDLIGLSSTSALADAVAPAPPRSRAARVSSAAVVAALLVAALIAAGVVVHKATRTTPAAPPPTSTPSAPFTVDALGHLQSPVEFLGVQLQPPTDGQSPALSQAQALAICRDAANGRCMANAGEVLTAALARATTDSGGRIQPDGSIKRTVDNRLVWAISWPSQCLAGGPVPAPGETPRPLIPTACTYLALLDADTGDGLFLGSQG